MTKSNIFYYILLSKASHLQNSNVQYDPVLRGKTNQRQYIYTYNVQKRFGKTHIKRLMVKKVGGNSGRESRLFTLNVYVF